MEVAVKETRRYVSARREQQARQTRREIVAAANRLMVDRGYAAATMELIAQEAGVAIQTIYSSVGNKRDLLWSVLETSVAGDDAARTLSERFRDELNGGPDPRDRLGRAVRFGRRVMDRSADVHHIMQSAASTDSEVASAVADVERRRYRDAGAIVRAIAGDQGFGPGMAARTAADLWFAVTSYEVYELLTGTRRWSSARYETCVLRALEPLIP